MEKIKVCFEHKIKLDGSVKLLCLAGAVLLFTKAKSEYEDHEHYKQVRKDISGSRYKNI